MTILSTDFYLTATQDGIKDPHCLDPGQLLQQAQRLNLQANHWWGKPNSYYNVRGKEPGRGFILLSKKDVGNIDRTVTQTLNIVYGNTTLTLAGLYFHRATALYTDSWDPGTGVPHLIELVDKRAIFALSTLDNKFYNTICPAPPADADAGADYSTTATLYYAESLNAGSIWTWQQMLDDIAGEIPGSPGTPTLPFSPDDKPRNFAFNGVSAWDAYNTILGKIGCVAIFNPITNTLTIDKLATAQDITALENNSDLISHYAPVESQTTSRPEKIRIYFHRTEEHFGSEKEIQQAAGNWIDSLPYSRDYTTSLSGAVSGTVLPVWDDMPAIYSFDGTHLNAAACNSRGDEVGTNLAAQILNSDSNLRVLQRGLKVIPFLGSKIARISWSDKGAPGIGMATEFQGSDVAPETQFQAQSQPTTLIHRDPTLLLPREYSQTVRESLQPTDVMRRGFPTYPRVMQMILVTGDKNPTNNIYSGKVLRLDPEQDFSAAINYTQGPDCYVVILGDPPMTEPKFNYLLENRIVLGRLDGSYNLSGTVRPLFTVQYEGKLQWALATSDWEENGVYPVGVPRVECRQCNKAGVTTGFPATVFDVYTPRNPRAAGGRNHDADPSVYSGFVIAYMHDEESSPNRICMSPYLHRGKISDILIMGRTDTIPPGWNECDGSVQTQNPVTAGAITLHDFKTTVKPLGGDAAFRAAMPRHISDPAEAMASRNDVEYFDALGEEGGQILAPGVGQAFTTVDGDHPHDHSFEVQMGSYVTCTVMYIQRYK